MPQKTSISSDPEDYKFRCFARKSDGSWSVIGAVMVPCEVDTQDESAIDDATKAEFDLPGMTIRDYAHEWFRARADRAQKVDTNHDEVETGAEVVESFVINEPYLGFKAESWLVRIEGNDEAIAQKIEKGELNALSWSGPYVRPQYLVMVSHALEATGVSEKSDAGQHPEHDHKMTITFGDDGKVIATKTEENYGHVHDVRGTTRTEQTDGHAHAYKIDTSSTE